MKFSALLLLILIFGCRENHQQKPGAKSQADRAADLPDSYPENLQKVFDAHGGAAAWSSKKTLSFTLAGEKGDEVHTVDLRTRKDRIEGPGYSLGFDGQHVWLANTDQAYEGDPVFYHNLMFYFYAMPFVFADEGLTYSETDPLLFEGQSFPGIQIGFESGVGASPKDEYYLYYDPDTHIMAWLGYTVTYFSGTDSNDIHWIKYDKWREADGLKLPETLIWFDYEAGRPVSARDTVTFSQVQVERDTLPSAFYKAPAGAERVE